MQQNTLGNIAYEITNYLGNVNVVISDRKIWNATPTNAFRAVILSKTDYTAFPSIACLIKERGIMPTLISLKSENKINRRYYFPFGQEISSRNVVVEDYRYGYNGMESDDENKGSGNSYTTEFRQYDPRLGRWLSLDPLMAQYPMMSPYMAFNNNPIYFVDPLGLEGESPGEPEKGYTCYDESHEEYLTYSGDGRWENFSKATESKNGLIISFSSIGTDEQKAKEQKGIKEAMKNDNSNVDNQNYYVVLTDDIRVGFEIAKEFSNERCNIPNVVTFRQHGNSGFAQFPIGQNNYTIISTKNILSYKSSLNLTAEEIDFFKKLQSNNYLIDNIETTLIFTNCHFGYGDDGSTVGVLIGEFTGVGKLFLNQDSSPRKSSTNLDYQLTFDKKDDIEIGWKLFSIFNYVGGFTYNVEETGKSLQLNSKGTLFSQPEIKK